MRTLCFVVLTITALVLSALASGAAAVADHAAVKVVPGITPRIVAENTPRFR
jgi:hypothetical protein